MIDMTDMDGSTACYDVVLWLVVRVIILVLSCLLVSFKSVAVW